MLLLAFVLVVPKPALAANGDQAVLDSLLSMAGEEPTLQDIMDSLGYAVDVDLDELGWQDLCLPEGGNIAVLVDEMSSSYTSAYAGFADAADSNSKWQLFGPDNVAGDTVELPVVDAENIAIYFQPGISGGYTWYTIPEFNRDGFDHAKLFATGVNPHEYVVAFEDLKYGGDYDYNDLVIILRFVEAEPVVDLGADISETGCSRDTLCFDFSAYDANCLGDTLTLEMLEGYGDFDPITSVGSIVATHCFLPEWFDETYTFIFKVTDAHGNSDIDTLKYTYYYNDAPTLTMPENFDTLVCASSKICFFVEAEDNEGDPIEFQLLDGPGSIDPETGEICFTPTESGSYTFTVRAADSCCDLRTLNACPPPGCPEGEVTVTVELIELPYFVSVPDTSVWMCEPGDVCFTIVAESPTDRPYTIEVDSPAEFDPQTGEACVYVEEEGTYDIEVRVYDEECGLGDVDTATIVLELNSPPTITLPSDTSLYLCELEEYCFFAIATDPDDDPLEFVIESDLGTVNQETGEICFTPDAAGSYEFIVAVYDTCTAYDKDTMIVDVYLNSDPYIVVPDSSLSLCDLTDEICFEVEYGDPDDNVASVELVYGQGVFNSETGEVCFTPQEAGSYDFILTITDDCGKTDTDSGTVTIELNSDPDIILPDIDSLYWCELGDSVCFDITVSDPDENQTLTIEKVIGPDGSLDQDARRFCFLPDQAGSHNFEFRVYDECLAEDYASTEVVIILNSAPTVTLPDDFSVSMCDPDSVCFPVTWEDDGDVTIEITPDIGTFADGEFCFYADKDSTYTFTVRAVDECEDYAEDEIVIDVSINKLPILTLPADTSLTACFPGGTVCFDYTATDPDGTEPTVSIYAGSGEVSNGQICFEADTSGAYLFIVRASDECDFVDEAVTVTVDINNAPELTVPEDQTVVLCGPDDDQICFDLEVSDADPDDDLTLRLVYGTVSGVLFPDDGKFCFQPSAAGDYTFIFEVSDECDATDEDTLNVKIEFNSAPTITSTDLDLSVNYCYELTEVDEHCFVGIEVSDPDEGDVLTVEKVSGDGTFYPETMKTCFTPALVDSVYEFCYRVTDACGDYDETCLEVAVSFQDTCGDTTVCLTVSIENTANCVYNSSTVTLDVYADAQTGIGGFDLIFEYDVTAFTFKTATAGPALDEWEYFTFRYGPSGDCGYGACPDGLIRVVAIADINNGANHPSDEAFLPAGTIIQLSFLVTDDVNFGGLFFPIKFFWVDCGDNSFSSVGGDSLYVDKLITDAEGQVVWDEFDDDEYPESERLDNRGAPDECVIGDKTKPVRCVIFQYGGICIIHPDDIDARGDLNLNELAYEIADAVLFTNFFIYGVSIFIINAEGQIAASDVNADGNSLTVGDLVYLMRVISGDADPVPKVENFVNEIVVSQSVSDGTLSIDYDAETDVGAGWLTFEFDPSEVTPGAPYVVDDASGMDVKYAIDGNTMRVLVYSMNRMKINSGSGTLIEIPLIGDGNLKLTNAEFSDNLGNELTVTKSESDNILPTQFKLSQNFPNPFNPETSFDIHLPEPSDWTVQIFNVQGQVVRTLSGSSSAGVTRVTWTGTDESGMKAASGIYFYRVTAGDFSDTKKMVLIK